MGIVEGQQTASLRDEIERKFATIDPTQHIDLEAQDVTALIGTATADLHRIIIGNKVPSPRLAHVPRS